MSDQNSNESETASRRLIREAKEEAWHARRKLRRELPSPSGETKRQLACALADYRDLLSDYKGERALDTPWEERDVDIIESLLSQTTTVERPLNRRGNAVETVEVPLVEKVDAETLVNVAKELDSIAKELGFAASAKQPTPQEEASMDDLRGLLKARGQEPALEHLPDGEADGESA